MIQNDTAQHLRRSLRHYTGVCESLSGDLGRKGYLGNVPAYRIQAHRYPEDTTE